MATNKENLAQWLLIKSLLASDKAEDMKAIAAKMVRELEEVPEPIDSDN